jgi:hypothetical protein
MLRWALLALFVGVVLRLLLHGARSADRSPGRPLSSPPPPRLTPEERALLEKERERALREGRQIDAIEIHRRLTRGGDVP